MKVKGLDGREYTLDTRQSQHKLRSEKACKSNLQFKCQQLIVERYPFDLILEEMHLPGCGNGLYLDFFLPQRKLAFEIHGKQHFTYTPFFHDSKLEFNRSVARDTNKRQWCDQNEIELIVVKDEKELRNYLGLIDEKSK